MRALQARDRQLAERHGISASQWHALQALNRDGPLTVTDLGEALYLEKSTASRLADSLIGDSLARKRPSLTDGRSVVLQLTERGKLLARRALNDRTELWMEVLGGVSEEDLSSLGGKLEVLLWAMD
jgi:DNA-binding MarR family transcriptional regulator